MIFKIFTSFIRILFLGVFFLLLFFADKFKIKIEYAGFPLSDNWYIRLTRLAFWFLVSVEILRVFYYSIIKSRMQGLVANIVTLVVPLVITLILLEVIFMYVPQSHEGISSKASQIWWEKYWHPVNELGYRDKKIMDEAGKINVLVIGDSFAAGHGLKNVNERFSDILQAKLGVERYSVYNLGVSGADTRDEAKRLEEFPIKPDIIILQYFPNDIEKAGRENGLSLSGAESYADLHGPFSMLVKRFYLPNFIYWQLPHTGFSTFEKFVQSAYTDTTVLNAHLRDLSRFTLYKEASKAEMYTVFIPFLFQLDKSAAYTKPVEGFLRSKKVHVITLNNTIAKVPEKDRIVGKNDGHASSVINSLIADKLFEAMKPDLRQH
ncbi:SGNH/GDSL hydrolase family protein [Dyadobacter flavalbus]|uniref:SGNH/GDSL hydrolase family protein n=1 Tax=Dyadobacter flavalbus TaxID=2579942 RepID=A0A5M8R171_9BACT|nr:SGNH/GDSL hydrolase family protein [Dyadobacter flavalbus]KAA6439972.1 SGNH/GDSL hydrolase family protein [Dyadobacter flavalbus]